jgi:hypothetical protein
VSGGLDHSGFDTKLRYDGGPFFSRFENIKALLKFSRQNKI